MTSLFSDEVVVYAVRAVVKYDVVAYEAKLDFTYAVVAICVVFVEVLAVGAVGVPVNAGEARLAFRLSAVVTKAVVATAVVELPAV